MKVCRTLACLSREPRVATLAIGVFDGLHLGHQRVISRAVRRARASGGEAWVFTFDVHPARVLKPEIAPPLLADAAQKRAVLESLGVDGALIVRFTRAFAGRDPERFVRALRAAAPGLKEIFVGGNWRFGRGGAGDVRLLRRLGRLWGYRVSVVPPVRCDGEMISSTRIRSAIAVGHLQDAARMLGRPFSIAGRVVRGRQIGRLLGFPTANIEPHNEVRPPDGVYAVRVRLADGLHDGVLSIGPRATFRDSPPGTWMEVHVFDLSRNLYGQTIEVFLMARLRTERRFKSADALARQIARDVRHARRVLALTEKKIVGGALHASGRHIYSAEIRQ